MAQGASKKTSSKPRPNNNNNSKTTRKGARVAKPKKGKGSSTADKLRKKLAAGLVAKTEKLLGERAGHLELIGKGKKARGEKEGEAKDKKKGGSRKFG